MPSSDNLFWEHEGLVEIQPQPAFLQQAAK